MRRGTRQLAGQVALLVVSALVPAVADAQSQLTFQAHGGGSLPLSAFVNSGIRLDSVVAPDTGAEVLQPRLVNQYNDFGFQVGATIVFNAIEFRYAFNRLTWATEETTCIYDVAATEARSGRTPGAVNLPTGEFDDSTAVYRCLPPEERPTVDISNEVLDSVLLHTISLGYRLELVSVPEVVDTFAAVGGGLAISTYTDNQPDENTVGFVFNGGVGADFVLTPDFAIAVESRYNLLLTAPVTRPQLSANRSATVGDPALAAVVEAFHYLTFSLGLSVNFR